MAKSIYLGVAGTAHKVKKMYTSIDGKARKVKKGYIGVNGVARQFYSAGYGDAPEGTYALNADADAMIYSIDPNTMINLGTVASGLAPIVGRGTRAQTVMMAAGGCAGEYVLSALETVDVDDSLVKKWRTGIVNPKTGVVSAIFETQAGLPIRGCISDYIITAGSPAYGVERYNVIFRDPQTFAQLRTADLTFDNAGISANMGGAPVGGNDKVLYLVHPKKRTSSLQDYYLEKYDVNTLARQASVNLDRYLQYSAVGTPDIAVNGSLYVYFRQTCPNDYIRVTTMQRDPNTLALISELTGIGQWWSSLVDVHSVK